jgi:hypothetical protein
MELLDGFQIILSYMLGVTSGGPNLILDSWMELTNSTIPEEVGYWLKRSCLGQVCLMQIHTNGKLLLPIFSVAIFLHRVIT